MIEFASGLQWWHWWIAAAVLGIVEAVIPGAVAIWFAAAAAVIGALLLVLPLAWQLQLILFGVLSIGALALWRYRDKDAWFLVLTAMMPQRWFFDTFILWLIPKSRREILFTAGLSWGAGVWRWYHIPHSFTEVGRVTVLFIYLPMLAVVLFRQFVREES